MKTNTFGGITPKIKKYYKYYILIIIFSMITPTLAPRSTIRAEDITLELQDIEYFEPIIEGERHNLTIIIKNYGNQAIPGGKIILNQLYINTITTPIDENSTNQGLSADTSLYLNLSWTPTSNAHTLIIRLLYDGTVTDEAWIPITVTEKETDLQVHTLTINGTLLQQQSIKIHANITNTGKKTTKTIIAALSINQKRIQNLSLIGLGKNQSHNFTFSWIPFHFGFHIINITIDPEDKITEANEKNNYRQKTIFIKPYQIEWYQPDWHYRKSLTINGTGIIALPMNFTHLLENLGLNQKTFENDTIVPIVYKQDGSIKKVVKQFTFQESSSYHPQTNANGILLINVTQEITYLSIYFDVEENTNNRPLSNEQTNLEPYGNLTIADSEQEVEGWWSDILLPTNNNYPLNKPSDITATTQAFANEVQARLIYEGIQQEILALNSTDLINWKEKYIFTQEGNWTINLLSFDAAGYQAPITQTGNITIQAIPDLFISRILLPQENRTEGNPVDINIRVNNSGDADAINYEIRLYITQGIMKWEDSDIRDKITLSINEGKNKNFKLTWESARYGTDTYQGNWVVGVWIITDTNHPDLNTLNNKATIYPLKINKGEQTPPVIILGNTPNQLEKGNPILITATITDTSGIQSANISIINPKNSKFKSDLTKETNNKYSITYTNTFLLGTYTYTITAKDASFYKIKTEKTGIFIIIEDATPPEIQYVGVSPKIQLLNTDVTFTCITNDLGKINQVTLNLNNPNGFQQDIELIQVGTSNKYRLTEQFSQIGQYSYTIYVQDESRNTQTTKEFEFWITTNLKDIDNDGMSNNWEERYGLNPYNPADSSDDLDEDGKTNLEEFTLQTNPTIEQTFAQQFSVNIKNNSEYLAAIIIFTLIIILTSLFTFKRR
jgi:hypothetical protein